MRWIKGPARWVFVIAADLSLLLCVCSVVFWVRGYFVKDMIDYREPWFVPSGAGKVEGHFRQTIVEGCLGQLRVSTQHSIMIGVATPKISFEKDIGQLFFHHSSPPVPVPRGKGVTYVFDRFGFRFGHLTQARTQSIPMTMKVVGGAVPYWSLAAVFGLLPAIRGIIWMRMKPKRDGKFCEKCGYDLRESKERCPECGMVVESNFTSSSNP